MDETMGELDYLEWTIKRMVEELQQKNCLSQEFRFLTKAERENALEEFVDDFINREIYSSASVSDAG